MEKECRTCKYFKQIANKEPCKSCYTKELPNWESRLGRDNKLKLSRGQATEG